MTTAPRNGTSADAFANEAQTRQTGILRELLDLLLHNKKWWLLPIVAVLLIVGILILLGGTAAAPFIYSLF